MQYEPAKPDHQVQVGDQITVWWSNGAGYSVYKMVDNPGEGQHLLELIGNWEVCNDGGYVRVQV